ncbi:hypothetical protein D3C86_1881350 [compost metagenome]
MKEKIVEALLLFAASEEGKKSMDLMLGATNFKRSTDADYDSVREMFRQLAEDMPK